MARNRVETDRAEKRSEILHAATELFSRDGVEGTSMAAVAAAAGVTKNTIYWYFDDKDDLLLAVLKTEFRGARERWQARDAGSLTSQLVSIVEMFDQLRPLTAALHARAERSTKVQAWHERFHAGSDVWLREEIAAHLSAARVATPAGRPLDLHAVARIWTYVIEGLVSHGASEHERRAVCEVLVRQLSD